MSEKSKFRQNAEYLWEHRRAVGVATVLGIAAIIYFSRFGNSGNNANEAFDASSIPQSNPSLSTGVSASEAPQSVQGQPDIIYLSGPDSRGISSATIFGSIPVSCVTINFPSSYFDPDHIDPKYDPNLPIVTFGSEALAMLGVAQSTVSQSDPVYVARGVNVQVVDSMSDHTWNMLGIATDVCN